MNSSFDISLDYDFMDNKNNENNNNKNNNLIDTKMDDNNDSSIELSLDLDLESSDDNNQKQTLNKRFENHISPAKPFTKIPNYQFINGKNVICDYPNPTGKLLRLNEVENLSIIDIDINHDKNELMDEKEAEILKNEIIEKCISKNYLLVESPSGGFHIYCNSGNDWINYIKDNKLNSRITKIGIKKGFDLDLFTSSYPDSSTSSSVTMVPTSVKYENCDEIRTSKFIHGNYDMEINYEMMDVLKEFKWMSYIEKWVENKNKKNKNKYSSNNNDIDSVYNNWDQLDWNDDQIKVLVDGIYGFEVHNYTNTGDNCDHEVSLMPLFKALNCIENQELRRKAYNKSYKLCTDKAEENFEKVEEDNKDKKTSLTMLIKILKNFNHDYYLNHVVPIYKNAEALINKIDLNDSFNLIDFKKKARNGCYRNLSGAIVDLSRLIRIINNEDNNFIIKMKDEESKLSKIGFTTYASMKTKLKEIVLYPNENGKKITAWNCYEEYNSDLSIHGVTWYSEDPNYYSHFHGFRYKPVNNGKSQIFIDFIKNIICNDNQEVFEYIINWIAYLIQKIDKKLPTAIVLTGMPGCGKTTFTNVLSKLLYGYSNDNVNDIKLITGGFNGLNENKKLIICNELKNVGEERFANFDVLKSLITETSIIINEKFIRARPAKNIASYIFVSNYSVPIKIEDGDRRYLCIEANSSKSNDRQYWKELYKTIDSDEFYEDLMYYFTSIDISEYVPQSIPITKEKINARKVCENIYDEYIYELFDKLNSQDGYSSRDLQVFIKDKSINDKSIKLRSMQSKLNKVCEIKRKIEIDGSKITYYKLKDEYVKHYENIDLY